MESTNNPLFTHAKMIITYVLPEYLDFKDIEKFKKTCRFAKDAMIAFEAVWENRFRTIADRYDMDISKLEKNPDIRYPNNKFIIMEETEALTCKYNRMYKVKNHPNTFRMFLDDGKIATGAEIRKEWEWINDKRYYEIDNRNDTIFTSRIPRLKTVCLYNPTIVLYNVPKGKYELYIRHAIGDNSVIKEELNLKVQVEIHDPDNEGVDEGEGGDNLDTVYYELNFPTSKMFINKANLKSFETSFIGDVDLSEYDLMNEQQLNVNVPIRNNDLWWKTGYTIDGAILIPKGSKLPKEMPTIISEMNRQNIFD